MWHVVATTWTKTDGRAQIKVTFNIRGEDQNFEILEEKINITPNIKDKKNISVSYLKKKKKKKDKNNFVIIFQLS